ncbi:AlpA family phage regulatory protein, partial [Salmonella enterica]|nr:AlpA family phage regulatory protein [Salmonella enterica subsp. enterica serovar Typhi]ECX9306591.1 AlpA family phage regulatory protein [Salmonella enterica]ELC7892151.1 AlpA family phage regulatory protein [Escherichia coli]
MVQNKTDKHPKLIRLPEVKRRTGFGKTWIYTLIRAGKFPKQV